MYETDQPTLLSKFAVNSLHLIKLSIYYHSLDSSLTTAANCPQKISKASVSYMLDTSNISNHTHSPRSMTGTSKNRMAEHKFFFFFKFWLATEWRFNDWALPKLLFTTAILATGFFDCRSGWSESRSGRLNWPFKLNYRSVPIG